MTAPVDTDALRVTARKAGAAIAAVAANGGRIQMRVPADPDSDTDLLVSALECDALAAADEVDRLRLQIESLQATIVCAPHAKPCALTAPPENTRYGARCTCWKADALN